MANQILSGESYSANPYRNAALMYRNAGWPAPIPVDITVPGRVITGTTGGKNFHHFPPSSMQIHEWQLLQGHRNIGLWLPDNVIGIDVDSYENKIGAETISWLETNITREPLPPTWTSTCRGSHQPSRIHFYRVPSGRMWTPNINIKDKGKNTSTLSGVEVIQQRHRWARVWPSIKTDKELLVQGLTYRWYDPSGLEVPEWIIPRISDLTVLSPTWQQVMRRRAHEGSGSSDMLNLNDNEAIKWIEHLPKSLNDTPCLVVRTTRDIWVSKLTKIGCSRHDTMVHGVWALIRDGISGHRGIADALATFYAEFMNAVSDDDTRQNGTAEAEWWRAVRDGVNRNARLIQGKTVRMCACHAKEQWAMGNGQWRQSVNEMEILNG